MILALLLALAPPDLAGPWRGVLDLVGAELRFALEFDARGGSLCNGPACERFSAVTVRGDSVTLELADYAATVEAVRRGDSLVGTYRNVGNRGPRAIPFRASRGRWDATPVPAALLGSWNALFHSDFGSSPRVVTFEPGPRGLQGTVIGNTGDYGRFWGSVTRDSFALQRFDGAYVYLLAGRVDGDTLRGTFYAGLRGRTPFTAVRSTGRPHLVPPDQFTRADTAPYRFAFRDLEGRLLTSDDPRFRGKVLLVDIFGTWCPACHDAAPTLVELYRTRRARGLEVVGLAFEVSGDTAVDGALVRRYRDKFGIEFPLLLAGINDTEAAAAELPQLENFAAFPTTLFIGRDGRVRRVHAGFYGPATGPQHAALVRDFARAVDALLAEPPPAP